MQVAVARAAGRRSRQAPRKPAAAVGMWPSSTISAVAGTCKASAPSPTLDATSSVRLPRSSPANWYSDSESGTGVTAPRMVAGSAPSATAIGKGRPGLACANSRKSSAPPRWASQRMMTRVAGDHLLAVDAQILAKAWLRHDCGPRVMTSPQVISGPASPGQQVWIGNCGQVDRRFIQPPPPGRARSASARASCPTRPWPSATGGRHPSGPWVGPAPSGRPAAGLPRAAHS
jgi:hypothetical protein